MRKAVENNQSWEHYYIVANTYILVFKEIGKLYSRHTFS